MGDTIREYAPGDLDALRRMHASAGFDYAFPDLLDPLFISKLVVTDGSSEPVMASLARLTCEMYLLVDRDRHARPADTYQRLVNLHRVGQRDLLQRGLEDAHAWIPPAIGKRFGRRLESLGWIRDDTWKPYCRRLRDR